MASNLAASLEFYRRWFDAEVIADFEYAGAQNVFVAIGSGRLHFYEQPPRTLERNAFNHIGLVVENLDELHRRMTEAGLDLPKGIQRYPDGNYLMVQAPDRVLLELFEPNREMLTPRLAAWFEIEQTERARS